MEDTDDGVHIIQAAVSRDEVDLGDLKASTRRYFIEMLQTSVKVLAENFEKGLDGCVGSYLDLMCLIAGEISVTSQEAKLDILLVTVECYYSNHAPTTVLSPILIFELFNRIFHDLRGISKNDSRLYKTLIEKVYDVLTLAIEVASRPHTFFDPVALGTDQKAIDYATICIETISLATSLQELFNEGNKSRNELTSTIQRRIESLTERYCAKDCLGFPGIHIRLINLLDHGVLTLTKIHEVLQREFCPVLVSKFKSEITRVLTEELEARSCQKAKGLEGNISNPSARLGMLLKRFATERCAHLFFIVHFVIL